MLKKKKSYHIGALGLFSSLLKKQQQKNQLIKFIPGCELSTLQDSESFTHRLEASA